MLSQKLVQKHPISQFSANSDFFGQFLMNTERYDLTSVTTFCRFCQVEDSPQVVPITSSSLSFLRQWLTSVLRRSVVSPWWLHWQPLNNSDCSVTYLAPASLAAWSWSLCVDWSSLTPGSWSEFLQTLSSSPVRQTSVQTPQLPVHSWRLTSCLSLLWILIVPSKNSTTFLDLPQRPRPEKQSKDYFSLAL